MTVHTLSIKQLEIAYQKTLIHAFSAELKSGDFVLLMGKNGSGKSTLLKQMCGVLNIKKGEIFMNQLPVHQMSIAEKAKTIAFVNNTKIEEPYLTVEDIVCMGRYASNLRIEKDEWTENAINIMGIQAIKSKYLSEISDGEWQKTNIARALAQNTAVVLLDEPSAFLDHESKIALFESLKELALKSNKIIIVSTHDQEIALQKGNQFWTIQNQTIQISKR